MDSLKCAPLPFLRSGAILVSVGKIKHSSSARDIDVNGNGVDIRPKKSKNLGIALRSEMIFYRKSFALEIKFCSLDGIEWIALTKWRQWKQDGAYHASKCVMLPLEDFRVSVWPKLKEMMDGDSK